MTKTVTVLFFCLLIQNSAGAQENDPRSAAEAVEKSEQGYLLRKKQVQAQESERQRGLELFLQSKEKYELEKELARKDYVEKKYGRRPASDSVAEGERLEAEKARAVWRSREIAREGHLNEVRKKEEAIESAKRKYRGPATFVRDNKPWNE
jgi:hypothetical protein